MTLKDTLASVADALDGGATPNISPDFDVAALLTTKATIQSNGAAAGLTAEDIAQSCAAIDVQIELMKMHNAHSAVRKTQAAVVRGMSASATALEVGAQSSNVLKSLLFAIGSQNGVAGGLTTTRGEYLYPATIP